MKTFNCVVCGKEYQARSWSAFTVPMCSPECKKVRRDARRKKIVVPCRHCGIDVECYGKKPAYRSLDKANRGYAYCSLRCRDLYMKEHYRRTGKRIAEYNRVHASERMKKNNPMHRPEVRKKMSRTLKAIGHRPKVRGGNGKPPTVPEALLAEALGWDTEVVVRTKKKRGSGYPTNYKIDVASKPLKVGIEIDGPCHHGSRKKLDKKKQRLLEGLGWSILRFSNQEVMENLEGCVREVWSTISKLRATTTISQRGS